VVRNRETTAELFAHEKMLPWRNGVCTNLCQLGLPECL